MMNITIIWYRAACRNPSRSQPFTHGARLDQALASSIFGLIHGALIKAHGRLIAQRYWTAAGAVVASSAQMLAWRILGEQGRYLHFTHTEGGGGGGGGRGGGGRSAHLSGVGARQDLPVIMPGMDTRPTTFIWLMMGIVATRTLREMASRVASQREAPMDSSSSTLSLPAAQPLADPTAGPHMVY